MAPLIGNFALWLSLIFACLQFILSSKKNYKKINYINRLSILGLLITTLIAFFSLMYSHVNDDFSVINVFQNSHTSKPILYKVSGVWGNHEGSMLLWITVLSTINFFIYKFQNKSNYILIAKALQVQAFITIGFILFVLATSNPFERIFPAQDNGMGFNPILQDPALAIHPPLLYFGYVGFSATFSISIATLILGNKNEIPWYRYMKPFVLASWTFLTAGIAFGSVWAYYELGWGGWWFWDPVENAAIMPWLTGTALLHSLISVDKKRTLQNWVLLLAILSFLLSVIGTFLVRSGILTSVHAFALDPERGIYILSFVTLLGVYSLSLFAIKAKNFINKSFFIFLSKEGAIFVNNIFMVIVCISVFFGTTYPLFVEIFSNNRISIGEPYFNSTVVPIMIPAIILMGAVPTLSWNNAINKDKIRKNSTALLCTVFVILILFLYFNNFSFTGFIGIFLSLWIIFNCFINIFVEIKKEVQNKLFSIKVFLKKFNSMTIAHLGVGLLILGITGSSVWQKENILRMKVNDKTIINNYTITFDAINEISGPNYYAIKAKFLVTDKNNHTVTLLEPENRIYPVTTNRTTEVSIHTNLIRDLYVVLGEGNDNLGWVVRIYYNPLVIWIWIGALIISLGGTLALKNNLKLLKKDIK